MYSLFCILTFYYISFIFSFSFHLIFEFYMLISCRRLLKKAPVKAELKSNCSDVCASACMFMLQLNRIWICRNFIEILVYILQVSCVCMFNSDLVCSYFVFAYFSIFPAQDNPRKYFLCKEIVSKISLSPLHMNKPIHSTGPPTARPLFPFILQAVYTSICIRVMAVTVEGSRDCNWHTLRYRAYIYICIYFYPHQHICIPITVLMLNAYV